MFDQFKNWVESILGDQYAYSMGMWFEAQMDDAVKYAVIQGNGGAPPDTDVRYLRFRVILLGRRNKREDASGIFSDANTLIEVAMNSTPPCGAASVRVTSEPSGPAYTVESRAWVALNLEVIF